MNAESAEKRLLSIEQIEEYIAQLAQICDGSPVFDCHVHATEIIHGAIDYGVVRNGILSAVANSKYTRPKILPVRLDTESASPNAARRNRLSEMAFTRAYQNTGPAVLSDHMALAGVQRAVLLPVAHNEGSLSAQMRVIGKCAEAGAAFIPGYSVPNLIPDAEIAAHLTRAIEAHNIRVVKIHPNVSGINLSAAAGRRRIESILRACGQNDLPVIVHGGCSPILGDTPESKFSVIANLRQIDWSASRMPVIIAHFGVYGCCGNSAEIPDQASGEVQALLDEHRNTYLDTSGVNYATMRQMLASVDLGRVIFGSDAMYVPIYRQMAKLMHAISELGIDLQIMRVIASLNAMKIFCRGTQESGA